MFRFLTAGESHGPQLCAIIEGMPAGVPLTRAAIDTDLRRRQGGYGRGARMRIEHDEVRVTAGVRFGRTIGSPIALVIENRDWRNWQDRMSPDALPPGTEQPAPTTRVRPGHADLAGALKFGHDDVRNVIERASARETAARVAVGGVARQLLAEFGIEVHSHVVAIGAAVAPTVEAYMPETWERVEASPVRCADADASAAMMAAIDQARWPVTRRAASSRSWPRACPSAWAAMRSGTSAWARASAAPCSMPSSKGCEIGGGFALAGMPGSRVHDVIRAGPRGFERLSNSAGGIEGGVSNGRQSWPAWRSSRSPRSPGRCHPSISRPEPTSKRRIAQRFLRGAGGRRRRRGNALYRAGQGIPGQVRRRPSGRGPPRIRRLPD